MKEANLKRLHTLGFQSYNILEKGNTIAAVKRSVVVRGRQGEMKRQSTKNF